MKLDLHPPEVVLVDFVAGRADDHGGLRPLHERLGGQPFRPKLLLARHRDKGAAVAGGSVSGRGLSKSI
jgi:hypothetical protein